MAVQIQGVTTPTLMDIGGSAFNAIKVQQMPVDYGSLGSYHKALTSGTMAAGLAAGADVFQFRWTSSTNLCLVQRVILDGLSSATGFTAGVATFNLFGCTSYTASGTGGTAGTLTGNNGKMRTSMGTTLVGDVRISSTAALGNGTKTTNANPHGQILLAFPTASNVPLLPRVQMFGESMGTSQPMVLAQNEGFAIQATVPATGTWQFGVTVIWTEVASY